MSFGRRGNSSPRGGWEGVILFFSYAYIQIPLGIDLLVCFLWFNPIVWLCRHELLKVHEFEADHDVLGQGIDKYDYQMSLLQMSMNVSCPVASGFSKPLIYQRFVEMKASVAGTLSSVGKVCLLAWVAGLFGIFSFFACQVTTVQSEGNPTPSSELFATLDSLPRLEKPETFTFEFICDSLCRDTVLYVFLSDDFFQFSNPVPAETLHVKDGKMTFQMELDHVIGMKWHLLLDSRLGFEHFCSPGDTLRFIAQSDENGNGRSWSPEESRTLRDNVDKYIHEFREFTQYQSPHMPKYDCTKWTDPVEEQSLYWSNISRQKEKLYAVKNVYFTDTATIVQVMPRFDFVVFGFRFLEDTCTCLIDNQGNKYKYIKTIYPSYHLDATVFGTYGVFEPINPNNIKSFSLMGPEPTVYTTIKNIRPRKQQKSVSEPVKPQPEQPTVSAQSQSFDAAFEAPKERLDDTIPGSSYTLGENEELKKKKQMDYDQWNTLCETYRNEPDVEYQNLKDTARYVSQLEYVLGAHTDVGVKMDEEIYRAERLVVRNPNVAKRLYEDVYAIEAKCYIGQKHHCSKTTSDKNAKYRVAFDEMNDDGILYFTYVESKEVPLPPEKQDSCLVIINGVERPEFATKQQAKAYIESLKLGKWSSTFKTIPTGTSKNTVYKHVFEIFYD